MNNPETLAIKESAYRLSFEISGLPQTPNTLLGAHWRKRSGHAKRWERSIWAKCWHLKPQQPLTRASVILTRFSSKAPDFDGLVGSFKPVIDGLVKCGILLDDSMEVIGQPTYRHERCRGGRGKIKVEVSA